MHRILRVFRYRAFRLGAIGLALIVAVIFNAKLKLSPDPLNYQPAVANPTSHPSKAPDPPSFKFPAGSQKLLPDHRLVALYGTPGSKALGSLGEQDLKGAIKRVKDTAQVYSGLSDKPVYPTFEIITTIASASATHNNDYSNELPVETIRPWVIAAKENQIYVVLDLQPGRTDFLSQAKLYEDLLKQPNVGLALDPEWRLAPGKKHLKQVGSVESSEINQVINWLADLTKTNDLPQKLLLIHQFKLSMIKNIESLDTSRDELAYLIQMDGLGNQNVKQDTWRNITGQKLANMYFGWKNFIDEDKPMLTPEATMQINPQPFYISYQ